MKIIIQRMFDLPPCVAIAAGEGDGDAQRFAVHSTPQTRRVYVVHVTGRIEPGTYTIMIIATMGMSVSSDPVIVTPEIADNVVIKAEIIAPVFDQFAVRVVRQAPLAAVPDPASE